MLFSRMVNRKTWEMLRRSGILPKFAVKTGTHYIRDMRTRQMLRIMAAVLLLLAIVMPVSAQYNSRGDRRYRDRFERTSTYGDVVKFLVSSYTIYRYFLIRA